MGRVQGTAKQKFTMTKLIKNKYVEVKVGTKSYMFELLDVQKHLSGELEKIRVAVTTPDAKISHQEARVQ